SGIWPLHPAAYTAGSPSRTGNENQRSSQRKERSVAVRIRMKSLGRKHRPPYPIVATDGKQPRARRLMEELGTYDPMVKITDNRVTLKPDRIKYWLSVGAQPSDKVAVLLKKYMAKAEEKAAAAPAAPPAAPTA